MLNLRNLIDDAKCYRVVRDLRWPDSVQCPGCASRAVTKRGFHSTQPHRQRYRCHACGQQFDDLSDTIFEGHHQPLQVWVLCLYLMGLNLSNEQIAQELNVPPSTAQEMTGVLRSGVVEKKSPAN